MKDTRHSDNYSAELIAAYLEIASYKWDDSFMCKREGCGHTKFYEGTTPYSRRCLKCKRDESTTAHTAFDKMRMPLNTCIEIVKLIVEKDSKLIIDEVTDELISRRFIGVNKRSVWLMMSRIFSVMKVAQFLFDEELQFMTTGTEYIGIVRLKGICKGKVTYSYCSAGDIYNVIKSQTIESTKVDIAYLKKDRNNQRQLLIKYHHLRPKLEISDEAEALDELLEFSSWTRNPDYYCFKKNNNNYEELMKKLVCSFGK